MEKTMRRFIIAALVSAGLSIPTATYANHLVGQTFTGPNARGECEAFLARGFNEGRAARREREGGGSANDFNQEAKRIRCRDNGDGSFTTVSDPA